MVQEEEERIDGFGWGYASLVDVLELGAQECFKIRANARECERDSKSLLFQGWTWVHLCYCQLSLSVIYSQLEEIIIKIEFWKWDGSIF